MDFSMTLAAFLMVVVANSAPWAIGQVMRERFAFPLDCNVSWPDGVRIFGNHKTWRGVVAALVACSLVAAGLGFGVQLGLKFGALAMLGDVLSSAIKRRLRLSPGTEVFGLDQLPEAMLPLLSVAGAMRLNPVELAAVVIAFLTLDAVTSRLRDKA